MSLIQLDPLMDFDSSMSVRSPGEVLLHDFLEPSAMPVAQLARRTGIPLPLLRKIILGQGRISAEFALRLSHVLESTPVYWLQLQARYDLATVAAGRGARRCGS
ncbi:HigA family addiction module antitoxin [Dyella sp. C9]|uniref:HigA family addiction module antitoxin n=1 Tax=Dyella sp. C9 TaxID=2202154 RepID=UPI000DEF6D4B|nr:HigA family addiction module antitoxin [Dyella sp. C9]